MKKILGIFFVLLSFVTFAKDMKEIKNITMEVNEVLKINGEDKKSEYKLIYIRPDFIRKEVVSPEFNKGEIYIYNRDKKTVYLPFFDQTTEDTVSSDENEVLKAINYILTKSEDKEFKKSYEDKKIKEIMLEDGSKVGIDNLKDFNGYLLPTNFTIYDKDTKIGELKIENYNLNQDLDRERLSKI